MYPVINNMVKALEEQIKNNSVNPNYPMSQYILEGFTEAELRTFIAFIRSFDNPEFMEDKNENRH